MKHLKKYRLFESQKYNMGDFMDIIYDLRLRCYDFNDGGCNWKILPEEEIQINLLRLAYNRTIESKGVVFKLLIDIRNIKSDDDLNSQSLPNWFINKCLEIESMMRMYGFKTLPSIKRPTDWEHFDTIDELSDASGLFREVQLLFRKIGE
jgi:hypothetical protein